MKAMNFSGRDALSAQARAYLYGVDPEVALARIRRTFPTFDLKVPPADPEKRKLLQLMRRSVQRYRKRESADPRFDQRALASWYGMQALMPPPTTSDSIALWIDRTARRLPRLTRGRVTLTALVEAEFARRLQESKHVRDLPPDAAMEVIASLYWLLNETAGARVNQRIPRIKSGTAKSRRSRARRAGVAIPLRNPGRLRLVDEPERWARRVFQVVATDIVAEATRGPRSPHGRRHWATISALSTEFSVAGGKPESKQTIEREVKRRRRHLAADVDRVKSRLRLLMADALSWEPTDDGGTPIALEELHAEWRRLMEPAM